MKFYPVNLNIKGKLCIVIGGGKVAERKIKNILFCGGKVKVISPELTSKLAELVKQRRIIYAKAEYHLEALKGAELIYAATSNRNLNSKIAKDAAKLGILVNVCDSAKDSSFILPAVLRKKDLVIAVSTDGISPEKAVRIRDKLKEVI
ncbi:bifunctional precorrin-2 dehydrogenase/sirohydrochlorin ferrochelatase [bacterium]|nr:bifunctional precorrin-2 dehydrogenase/sirohydrochlorin ferrochelatase [bacterium]